MKLALTVVFGAAMAAGDAEASMQWRWTCEGPGFEAKGALTTDDKPDMDGFYAITGVTGEANGVAITALQSPRTAIPGNAGYPVDNVLRPAAPQLSNGGFGFALADGTYVNPFFGARFVPPGFYAVISNPAKSQWREPQVDFEASQGSLTPIGGGHLPFAR
jgi:hypothetical protein